jgi:hypothetical protein
MDVMDIGHIKDVTRWFELAKLIMETGEDLGEARFEKFLQTLVLSRRDVEEIITMIELANHIVVARNNYCIRKLKDSKA